MTKKYAVRNVRLCTKDWFMPLCLSDRRFRYRKIVSLMFQDV